MRSGSFVFRIAGALRREWSLFWLNKVFVVAFLFMPLVFALVTGFVYRKGKITELPVIVVDKDHSPSGYRFRDMLQDHQAINIIATATETTDLHQLMLHTRAVGVVVIPYHFEAELLARKRPEVICYLNMANTLTANAVGSGVTACAATMNAAINTTSWQKKGLPLVIAQQQHEVFKSNIFYQYNPGNNYLYFLWPGFIFSTLHQLLLLALAVSFSQEVAAGTFNKEGLLGYSRSPLVLIFIKLVPYLLMSCWTVGVYYSLSVFFRVPFPEHPWLLLLSQLLMVTGASLLGICISIIYPLPLKASQLLMSIASPAFTISGFTWPAAQAPVILATLGKIIPLTPYLGAMRMLLLQRASFTDVWPVLQHQLLLIAVYAILAMVLLQRSIIKTLKPVVQTAAV